ncbi:hypothetical protein SCORR_v1c08570 [Spiroplasma corruscae]|uniref:Uncharacterized protein n=1 Tax=Spiroplasma corruscae TaxID=216934 RepID=A0A222EQ15_9MOLU|nr:hypothetical protein [Spiroplasma corruscae]ASP28629.1 hypothetical protein SCORR_v1c08570 [Spiroplasma corruscae]
MKKIDIDKINKNMSSLKKMFVIKRLSFYNFIANIVLFFLLIISVIVNETILKNIIMHYINLGFSGYLLLIFTFIGWFSTEYYYRDIKVIDIEWEKLHSIFKNKRIVELSSIKFIIVNIILSFVSVIIFIFEILASFKHNTMVSEIGIISIHLLIIPAFVRMFESIIESLQRFKKLLDHFLIKQFDTLENLFEHVKFEKNNTRLLFLDYNLESKHNIFLLTSDYLVSDQRTEIEKANELILNTYKELWKQYLSVFTIYLSDDIKKARKRFLHKVRRILIYYLVIWDDFFDFK